MRPATHYDIARRAARDLPDACYVNLGVGIPGLVAGLLDRSREIVIHSENGILGVGPPPPAGQENPEVCDASKNPITLLPGAAIFSHSESFLMVRGHHLDLALLGAFQISERGDLANWKTVGDGRPPAVGGAMDLAVGARGVWALMEHVQKDGTPRILRDCLYPLTAARVVNRIYTDLCTMDVTAEGLIVRERLESLSLEALQERTDARLRLAENCRTFAEPQDV